VGRRVLDLNTLYVAVVFGQTYTRLNVAVALNNRLYCRIVVRYRRRGGRGRRYIILRETVVIVAVVVVV